MPFRINVALNILKPESPLVFKTLLVYNLVTAPLVYNGFTFFFFFYICHHCCPLYRPPIGIEASGTKWQTANGLQPHKLREIPLSEAELHIFSAALHDSTLSSAHNNRTPQLTLYMSQ